MLSLEPATITNRSYPLLFQTGETAYGRPLVDAQHPHNFIMALGAHYAHPLGSDTMLQLYYAPVGDPALGPVAFPHRASAAELPQAPLGHHWQDSTHIADNVATVAVQHAWLRLEASGFYGTEPGENRWHIDWGPMNSYSGRLSVAPIEELDLSQVSSRPPDAAGAPGAGRRGADHRFGALQPAHGSRRIVVHQPDLGPQSRYRDAAQPEFVSARNGVPGEPPQLPDRPLGDGGQGRTVRRTNRKSKSNWRAPREAPSAYGPTPWDTRATSRRFTMWRRVWERTGRSTGSRRRSNPTTASARGA